MAFLKGDPLATVRRMAASYLSEMATGGQLCKSLLVEGRDINRWNWKRLAEFRVSCSFDYREFSVRVRESGKEIGSIDPV